jgi:Na+/H+ antiporter NhaB
MAKNQPDGLATFLGHAIVGVGVALVMGKVVKAAAPGVLVVTVIGILAHDYFDAPVSQALGDVGI